jgi:hypothetical protein
MELRQIPSFAPGSMSHVTLPSPGNSEPRAPQQSLSWEHSSPVTWQPLGGWQMNTPVEPWGAHRLLQQSPQPLHTAPGTPLQFAGPSGGDPQVPTAAPSWTSQMPEQQSPPRLQMSPC